MSRGSKLRRRLSSEHLRWLTVVESPRRWRKLKRRLGTGASKNCQRQWQWPRTRPCRRSCSTGASASGRSNLTATCRRKRRRRRCTHSSIRRGSLRQGWLVLARHLYPARPCFMPVALPGPSARLPLFQARCGPRRPSSSQAVLALPAPVSDRAQVLRTSLPLVSRAPSLVCDRRRPLSACPPPRVPALLPTRRGRCPIAFNTAPSVYSNFGFTPRWPFLLVVLTAATGCGPGGYFATPPRPPRAAACATTTTRTTRSIASRRARSCASSAACANPCPTNAPAATSSSASTTAASASSGSRTTARAPSTVRLLPVCRGPRVVMCIVALVVAWWFARLRAPRVVGMLACARLASSGSISEGRPLTPRGPPRATAPRNRRGVRYLPRGQAGRVLALHQLRHLSAADGARYAPLPLAKVRRRLISVCRHAAALRRRCRATYHRAYPSRTSRRGRVLPRDTQVGARWVAAPWALPWLLLSLRLLWLEACRPCCGDARCVAPADRRRCAPPRRRPRMMTRRDALIELAA